MKKIEELTELQLDILEQYIDNIFTCADTVDDEPHSGACKEFTTKRHYI